MFSCGFALSKKFNYVGILYSKIKDEYYCEINGKRNKISRIGYNKILKTFIYLKNLNSNKYIFTQYSYCYTIINSDNVIYIEDDYNNQLSVLVFIDNTKFVGMLGDFDILKPVIRNKKLDELIKLF